MRTKLTRHSSTLLLLAALHALGCGAPAPAPASPAGVEVKSDGGSEPDAGPGRADAGADPDGGATPDGGVGPDGGSSGRAYPLHTAIISTTFWVGEIFDPTAPDGSQVFSTFDSKWEVHYGGCDGDATSGSCQTEARAADNGFFPRKMTPLENPFYLDLPFDDLNDATAFAMRATVIPWASDPGYAGRASDRSFSFMKNRWVKLSRAGHVCYGQIEDAGPGQYHDAAYVFGSGDARPANTRFNGAGMDVSPALNGCLAFTELNGQNDAVSWQFVDDIDVPDGPWKRLVTTSGITP